MMICPNDGDSDYVSVSLHCPRIPPPPTAASRRQWLTAEQQREADRLITQLAMFWDWAPTRHPDAEIRLFDNRFERTYVTRANAEQMAAAFVEAGNLFMSAIGTSIPLVQ